MAKEMKAAPAARDLFSSPKAGCGNEKFRQKTGVCHVFKTETHSRQHSEKSRPCLKEFLHRDYEFCTALNESCDPRHLHFSMWQE
jgi:hypothetical protein